MRVVLTSVPFLLLACLAAVYSGLNSPEEADPLFRRALVILETYKFAFQR